MTQQAHDAELELLRRDIEDAFERVLKGNATDTDKSLLAWQLGIGDHWKRISTKGEKQCAG